MARRLPIDSMESWLEQMSEQFETAAERWGSGFEGWAPELDEPRIDLVEYDDEYVITANVPGFDRDDVEVLVTDHTLSIEAEQTEETMVDESSFIRRERSHATMKRRITLPNDADTEAISASLDNGVLEVHVARAEPLSEGHRIDIS